MIQQNSKNILVFGKSGQVGNALCCEISKNHNFELQSYGSKDVDFSNLKNLTNFLKNLNKKPSIIINAVAYTNVDKAEDEKELADIINHQAVAIIANFCKENNILLIHYSTDYVFDGSGDKPFSADNTKNLNPINHYGKTKLAGEKAIINLDCDYLIIRTSWVYDDRPTSKNFVNTIKKLAQEKEELKIVDDQIGSPTSAKFIARKTIELIFKLTENNLTQENSQVRKILHCIEEDYMSWYDFAKKILNNIKNPKTKKITTINSEEYLFKASRPKNSRLVPKINF